MIACASVRQQVLPELYLNMFLTCGTPAGVAHSTIYSNVIIEDVPPVLFLEAGGDRPEPLYSPTVSQKPHKVMYPSIQLLVLLYSILYNISSSVLSFRI